MKIIINRCYGGFRLSEKALMWLHKNKGWKITDYNKNGYGYKDKSAKIVRASKPHFGTPHYAISERDELRVDKDVMECIEKLGDKANSKYSKFKIVEIPDDIEWEIDEYDGIESVHEKHEVWD